MKYPNPLPPGVTIESGPNGLDRVAVSTRLCEGHMYPHGAHVAHYQRPGEKPILWMSGKSMFDAGKPIRGGVPVCFPWFGARQGRPDSPSHGFARLMEWKLGGVVADADGAVAVTMSLGSSDATRAQWPHDFAAVMRVGFGRELTMTLAVTNTGKEPFTFEEAMHTYFTVGDVRKVRVLGLENVKYLSKVEGGAIKSGDQPITITAETDRVYMNTGAACVLDDASLNRRVTVSKSGSETTVVWNPWVAKAHAMPDFGDDEWPGMICIETANAGVGAVMLKPGAAHEMTARIA
ncbi:MAG: D-hexose-6-phosphate mutarotase [Planctomycetes bacterium]|nr:D-hexose-6-phosphate mutarotase [Planctomycetota bacterium]